jgi:cytoskeletal protein CcmA (bactofilin family)
MFADLARRALRFLALLPGFALVTATGTAAQQREVVSKQIAVGRSEASLRLEFDSGDPLEIQFLDGGVRVDGEALGAYTPELDAAWRALLSDVVTLEDGPLAVALREWTPPDALGGEARELAARVNEALEGALGAQALASEVSPSRDERAFAELLSRQERLADLAAAAEDLRPGADVRLYVGESVEVEADEEIDATVVLVDGDMTVRGVVDGDVVVVGGRLRVERGGRITGDVRALDGSVERAGGEIAGDVVEVEEREAEALGRDVEARMRQEILSEIRSELGDEQGESRLGVRLFSPFRNVARAVAGVLSGALTILVLSLVGGVFVHFAHNHLEVVAETARRAPGRAAAVGVAGVFLAVPVWLLGAVALVISIIGIPVALLWLPFFPVALALAAVLGYYAVARNVGGWVARREYPYTGWVRLSNPFTLVAAGVLALLGAFVLASALQIGGSWLGFLRGLFVAGGVLATVVAVLIGLGAVLITRGGRRPEFYAGTDFFGDRGDDDLGTTAASGDA